MERPYGKLGYFKEEFEAYQEAIRINPRLAQAHYNIKMACEKLKGRKRGEEK